MDELLTADEPLVGQLDESLDDVALYAEYRRLVEEQAAVRRVGTLVARGAEPSEVVGAVAEEMRRCVGAFTAGLWRFETNAEITLVAAAADPAALAKWPVGTRTPIEGNTLATVVQRTGLPARIDSYENIAGVGRRTGACGRRPRGGGSSDHRRRQRSGIGGRRFRGTWPHAGRHRDAHQPVRGTDRHCSGGGLPRGAEEAAPGRDIAAAVPD